MHQPFRSRATLTLLTLLLGITSAACSMVSFAGLSNQGQEPQPDPAAASTAASPTASPAPDSAPVAAPDPFQEAIDRASSAFTIGQSAQSQDDWRLVVSRWQQAIQLLTTVPSSSPHYGQVQPKLTEYRRNLTYAQQQASQSAPRPSQGVIVFNPDTPTVNSASGPSANRATAVAPSSRSSNATYEVPIVRRVGGTPVIHVTFNGNQRFEMIVDTGASGTLITQPMATALGVVTVGQANVATASSSNVSFPLGYVRSIAVDQAIARNVLVAVAGPNLAVGLLGHDFFGNYDVTIRADVVEFRER